LTPVACTGSIGGTLVTALFIGALLTGYLLRMLHEQHIQKRRERALLALSGELPEWEQQARRLEDQADREEIEGLSSYAESRRQQAAAVRRVARRRLRQGRSALP
jgi:hypothetical protein